MPVYWAIASNIMIEFVKKMAPTTGYPIKSNDDIIAIIQQIVFADDNLTTTTDDEELKTTIQPIQFIQAIMNIRSQPAKSNLIITEAVIKRISQKIEEWKRDKVQ